MPCGRCLFADGPINDRCVLVAGGAGAVGHAAIQLAKRGSAEVIATTSTPEKAALAEQAGADLVVNYREPGTADRIRKAAPTGIDRILELTLATNLELDLAVIKHGGTIMTYSPERADPQLPVARLMREGTRLSFMLIYTTPPEALRAAVEAITSALIDRALRHCRRPCSHLNRSPPHTRPVNRASPARSSSTPTEHQRPAGPGPPPGDRRRFLQRHRPNNQKTEQATTNRPGKQPDAAGLTESRRRPTGRDRHGH
jgi:hypothetical protein